MKIRGQSFLREFVSKQADRQTDKRRVNITPELGGDDELEFRV